MNRLPWIICLGCLLVATPRPFAGETAESPNHLRLHLQHLLNDGDQWRTANPGFEPGEAGPRFFGLRFVQSPDGSHVTGSVSGLFPGGEEATYWSLLMFYNPVTQRVITQQIGWDGTLLYGEVPVQTGTLQIVDLIHYGADGSMKISRHENRFLRHDLHASTVFERGPDGNWQQEQSFEWARYENAPRPPRARASADSAPGMFDSHVEFLLSGSGQWRAPNPDFEPDGDSARFYGINYRFGPHRRHVIGEIVSIFEGGRTQHEWSMYITHNPVTGKTHLDQVGKRGVYFRGEFEKLDSAEQAQQGLIYMPNGTIKSVRDRVTVTGDDTYEARVFERAADGSWQQVRAWTWSRVK